jgi:ribosomal protein S30
LATETLVNLRLRVRERSDQVNTNQFVSDAELTRYINASYREYYDLVLESHADHYLATPVSFTLSAGVSTYALSSLPLFYRLRGIDRVEGTDYIAIRRFTNAERNEVRKLSYRVMGTNLYFQPTTAAPGNYRCWYIPEPAALTADGDTVDGFNGWEEWIVCDVASKIAAKAEEDVSPFVRDRDRVADRIRKASSDRDEGDAEVISDVFNQRNWDTWSYM